MSTSSKSAIKIPSSLHDWMTGAIAASKATLPTSEEIVVEKAAHAQPAQDKTSPSANDDISQPTTQSHIRKLVTVRMIDSITILSPDSVKLSIEGWNVVADRDKGFGEGELILYFEVDSFLPKGTKFEKLFSEAGNLVTFEKKQGYRVTTERHEFPDDINGNVITEISQGLACHVKDFPHIYRDVHHRQQTYKGHYGDFPGFIRNVDYSEFLKVKKWEPEEEEEPDATPGKFPSFILRTTMDRVQNCPNLFIKAKYRKQEFQESVKLDGSSMTCFFVRRDSKYMDALGPAPSGPHADLANFPDGRFGVCSRTASYPPAAPQNPQSNQCFWHTALKFDIPKKLAGFGQSIALQGEVVGWDIQKNPYGHEKGDYDFFVYGVYDIEQQKRWNPRRVEKFAAEIGLKHVEVLGYHRIPELARDHQELIDRAELKPHEGLVYKNCTDGRWFKVLSNWWIINRDSKPTKKQPATGCSTPAVSLVQDGSGSNSSASNVDNTSSDSTFYCVSEEEIQRIIDDFYDPSKPESPELTAWLQMWEEEWTKSVDQKDDWEERPMEGEMSAKAAKKKVTKKVQRKPRAAKKTDVTAAAGGCATSTVKSLNVNKLVDWLGADNGGNWMV